MDFALQAALLGAVTASAILAAATVYAASLPAASTAFAWWAAAFVVDAASQGTLVALGGSAAFSSDLLHGASAVLTAIAAVTLRGRPFRAGWGAAGVVAFLLWGMAAQAFRERLAVIGVPIFGVGGLPLLFCGWAVLASRPARGGGGHRVAAFAFAVCGVQRLAAPLFALHPITATWSLVFAQVADTMMTVGVLLLVLKRQLALSESHERRAATLHGHLVEALAGIRDGVALYGSDGGLITTNDRYREADWQEVVAAAGLSSTPRECQMADGRWLAVNAFPTADGGQLRLLSDITNRKQAELALTAIVAWQRGIMDTMVDGLICIDPQGTVLTFNPAASRIFGYPPEEVLGRNVSMLMPEGEHPEHDDYLARFREAGEARAVGVGQLVEGRRKDGTVFPTELALGEWDHDDTVTIIGVVRDITERKRTEDTLREAKEAAERGNRTKASFLANISHELRTPLNAIIGFSELMKHEIFGPLEPVPYRAYVDDINESGMHLLELINDILDMSKAEAGMTDLMEGEVDLVQAVRSAIRMMTRRAQLQRVDLVVDLPDDLPHLRADERRLRQILLNLLSNAVKFTDENGTVTISARAGDEGMELKVADTGIGMTEAELARVMEPFVQADARLSRKYEGTGLGLPLSKALVEAHGGRLVLESQPGEGTTVIVTFPPERLLRSISPAFFMEDADLT